MEFTMGGGEISFYFMNFFHVGKFYKEHLLFCKKKIRKLEIKQHRERQRAPLISPPTCNYY